MLFFERKLSSIADHLSLYHPYHTADIRRMQLVRYRCKVVGITVLSQMTAVKIDSQAAVAGAVYRVESSRSTMR